MASGPQHHAAVDLTLAPVHSPARQLVAGLERADVLLTVTGRLGIQRLDDLGAMPPARRATPVSVPPKQRGDPSGSWLGFDSVVVRVRAEAEVATSLRLAFMLAWFL